MNHYDLMLLIGCASSIESIPTLQRFKCHSGMNVPKGGDYVILWKCYDLDYILIHQIMFKMMFPDLY